MLGLNKIIEIIPIEKGGTNKMEKLKKYKMAIRELAKRLLHTKKDLKLAMLAKEKASVNYETSVRSLANEIVISKKETELIKANNNKKNEILKSGIKKLASQVILSKNEITAPSP